MDRAYAAQYLHLWHKHWWWRARHRYVLRQLEEVSRRSASGDGPPRILDVGCCGGVGFDDWSRFGTVWGIEPDERLAASTPRWSHRVTRASIEELEPPAEPFDWILMLDVLEHIEDDLAALEKVRGLLVPGGTLLMTVPAFQMLWSVHDEANAHYRRYRRAGLVALLERAGYAPVACRYFFGWTFGLVWLRRVLAGGEPSRYRVRVPPAPLNALLEGGCRLEQWLSRKSGVAPPFGSSLLAVASAA